ncbi:MAG TPA: hypothetical protein VLS93_14950 [Anaeromyxobacteraceae bacterium]|nr:hypothetical protein [Anaeromyxobacteraceae bacterium]
MRVSRPRLFLRAVLLAAGGGYMVWHALDLWHGSRGLDPAEALLRQRFALLWALVALVAFVTAAVALFPLRRRAPRRPLHLDRRDAPGPSARPSPGDPGPDGSPRQ